MTATLARDVSTNSRKLYMAIELSRKHWKLGFGTQRALKPRVRSIVAGDGAALEREIVKARKKLGVEESAPVLSCYEAGLDGFWVHRWLTAQGIVNVVVDSCSIEVNRRSRRAKSDSLDVGKLLSMLMRHDEGERVWSVVRVPGVEDEADRQLHRELLVLRGERTGHINRIKGLLASLGLKVEVDGDFEQRIEALRTFDERALSGPWVKRLNRECERLRLAERQIKELEDQRRRLIVQAADGKSRKVGRLLNLRGIGLNSAWLYVMEVFGWREIRNRRQLGSLCGLTPTPYNSGQSIREQGISKAGNRRVRAMAIEIAWSWLRYQPDSELSRWFERRFSSGGKRMRRIGIVALARKLLVALWKYLEHGEVPAGAMIVDGQGKVKVRMG